MQVRYVRTFNPSAEGPLKVTAISWSPSSSRLAVATADRVVSLYDENGEQRKDKFPTKAAIAGQREYFVTGLAWSPDSTKLAVAQSDNIVFVYKVCMLAFQSHAHCLKKKLSWPRDKPRLAFSFSLAHFK